MKTDKYRRADAVSAYWARDSSLVEYSIEGVYSAEFGHVAQGVYSDFHADVSHPSENCYLAEASDDMVQSIAYIYQPPTRNLLGRVSDHAYMLHKEFEEKVIGFTDYINFEHAVPVYLTNIQTHLMDRVEMKRTADYQDAKYVRSFLNQSDGQTFLADIDETIEYMMDPVSGSAAKGRKVLVDDVFMTGSADFKKLITEAITKDFKIGHEDTNDVMFCGQRLQWNNKGQSGAHISVDQDLRVEELSEIEIPSQYKGITKENMETTYVAGTDLHSAYRSLSGKINWLQNRTRYDAAYDFSRCASASASPRIADVMSLNRLAKRIRSEDVKLKFWPLKNWKRDDQNWRLVGYPDASSQNNSDKSSQRGLCIYLCAPRLSNQPNAYGSLVEYESHKIKKACHSTTVAELYALMKCFGSCLFHRGLWMDMTGTVADIHMRTDAKKIITTAQATHLPNQKETIHMIQMLRHEACSGAMDDFAHVSSADMMADTLTKSKCENFRYLRNSIDTSE